MLSNRKRHCRIKQRPPSPDAPATAAWNSNSASSADPFKFRYFFFEVTGCGLAGLEVLGASGEHGPDGHMLLPGIVFLPPWLHNAPAFIRESQMLALLLIHLLLILWTDQGPAHSFNLRSVIDKSDNPAQYSSRLIFITCLQAVFRFNGKIENAFSQ